MLFTALHQLPSSQRLSVSTQCATILQEEWPHGSTHAKRVDKLLADAKTPGLPQSFALTREDGRVVAHVRLQEAADISSGRAVAVTSVVVSQAARGTGVGRQLMDHIERHAQKAGFGYMYLWTYTAVGFYDKCGFHQCDRVSLSLPVFKSLTSASSTSVVESLEKNLTLKLARMAMGPPGRAALHNRDTSGSATNRDDHQSATNRDDHQSTTNPDDHQPTTNPNHHQPIPTTTPDISDAVQGLGGEMPSDDGSVCVWMRKRLVDFVDSSPQVAQELFCAQVARAIQAAGDDQVTLDAVVRQVPWQQQIGPSCGLTALRMVDEYVRGKPHPRAGDLMQVARDSSFTVEGEMFNIGNLHTLATTVLDLDAEVCTFAQVDILRHVLCNGVVVLPYDRNSGTNDPGLLGGAAAHYGVVVGVAFPGQSGTVALVPSLKENDVEAVLNKLDEHRPDLHLILRHSGNDRVVVACMASFLASNQQLWEAKLGLHNVGNWKTEDMDLAGKCLVVRGGV